MAIIFSIVFFAYNPIKKYREENRLKATISKLEELTSNKSWLFLGNKLESVNQKYIETDWYNFYKAKYALHSNESFLSEKGVEFYSKKITANSPYFERSLFTLIGYYNKRFKGHLYHDKIRLLIKRLDNSNYKQPIYFTIKLLMHRNTSLDKKTLLSYYNELESYYPMIFNNPSGEIKISVTKDMVGNKISLHMGKTSKLYGVALLYSYYLSKLSANFEKTGRKKLKIMFPSKKHLGMARYGLYLLHVELDKSSNIEFEKFISKIL